MAIISGPKDRIIDYTDATKNISIPAGTDQAESTVPIDMNDNEIIGVKDIDIAAANSGYYAANKNYVDSVASSLNPNLKLVDVDLISDSNEDITSTTERDIDGVTITEGMRIALTSQTNVTENTIVVVQSDFTLDEASDWTVSDVEVGSWFFSTQGSTYANTGWYISSVSFEAGSEYADFSQFSNADGSVISKPIMISYDRLSTTNTATGGLYAAGTVLLLIGQTDKSENGIWVSCGAGNWVRPDYYASGSIVPRGALFISSTATVYVSSGEDVIVDTDNQEIEILMEDYYEAMFLKSYLYTYGNPQTMTASFNIKQKEEAFLSIIDVDPVANTSAVTVYKGRHYGDRESDVTLNDRLFIESGVIYQDNSHDGMLYLGSSSHIRGNWVKSATNVPTWISAQKGTDWSISAWVRHGYGTFGVINTEAVSGHSYFQGLSINANARIESGTGRIPEVYYIDSSGDHKRVQISQADDLPFHFGLSSSPNATNGKFYHVVITHTETTDAVTIHINGVSQTHLITDAAPTPDTPENGTDLIVGCSWDGAQAALGKFIPMCDIMLFDTALDQDNIDMLYNNGYGIDWSDVATGSYPDPDVWYKFDETDYTTSDTLADSSTTGTGTLSIEVANCHSRIETDDMNIYHSVIDMYEDPTDSYESLFRVGSQHCKHQLRGALVEAPDGDISISKNGSGLKIEASTNGKMGSGTANGTTGVTVSNTSVTASSYIFITPTSNSNLGMLYIDTAATVAGTSFAVKSTDASDVSTFNYLIVEPA